MPKEISQGLFRLIKSMKKSEKRYFKLFTHQDSKPEDPKFLKLFNLIDKQSVYDEEEILAKEPEFLPSQLSNLKAHLYKRILQSLRRYNAGSVSDIQIREHIDHAQILYNRSLYTQCARVLHKAKKLANRYHSLELLLEILKWEKNVLSQTIGRGNQKRVNEIIQQVQDVNNRINNINTLTNLSVKLNALYLRKGYVRNEKDYHKITDIFESGMPDYHEGELSFHEKLYLYNAHVTYYFFIQDFKKGSEFAQKWVDLFDQSTGLIPDNLDMYIKGLNSLMVAQYKLMRYHAFVNNHKKLKAIRQIPRIELDENIKLKLLKYTYVHEFNRYFMLGDFDIGVALMNKIKPGLEQFIHQLDKHSRLVMYYKIACLYFGNNNFRQAIRWLNQIINSEEVDIREDVHSFARIINLICHYELGHTEVIPYYLRSTYRFLSKQDDLHQFQKYILAFIKGVDQKMTDKELIGQFQNLRKRLLPLVDSPYEKRAFIYFDIISWLESRIEQRPVQEVIKSKSRKIISPAIAV